MPLSMCECYVMAMPNQTLGDFRTMLRSGLMGWFSLMQDPNQWTSGQRGAAKEEFAFYKSKVRPLIQNGFVYHVSDRPDGVRWDGLQLVSESRKSSVLIAFRGSGPDARHLFNLKGLRANGRYRLHFLDGESLDTYESGASLMSNGIPIELSAPGASQIVQVSQN